MKTKRLLSGVMSVVMIFTMFFAMTLVVNTAAPVTASAEGTATATTKAIYVGPSTRYANNVPSGIFLPIPRTGKYGDGTIAEITAKVKMLNGTKPFVQMMRTATSSKDGTVSASAGSVVFYQGDGIGSNWHDNSASSVDSNGVFHCNIKFKDIPGEGNCFYSSVWDGGTEYRKSNIDGRNQPIGCGVFIGNTVLNDDMSVYAAHNDLSMEFIISDIHITLTSVTGGDGTAQVGDDLAPSETILNTGARYFFVGDSKQGNRPDAKNHPLNGRLDQWNICTPDEDTVRQVTVADDIFDGGTHTYTKHNETNDEFEYYTCADFGTDVKFEKIGNCYSRYLDDDAAKKAFIIKSHAGDSKELTSNQGSSTVANIFIPLNIHKFYSAYNASTCGSADLREDGTAVRFGVSFKARRVSGTGQPVVGVAYADGNANGASGTSYKDAEFGAPREYGKDRSYNNGLEKSGSRTKQSDWVSSSYNASTGEFTALLSTESGYYKQMSRDGKSAYISIGLAEHLNSSLEALNTDSTFVISDIKFTVYDLNNSSTVLFGGANQAPKMCKANCDTETPYQYGQLWDYNEKVNGLINVGVRHAPLNKYSVDGAIQNVFLINSNVCNRSGCTLTHHAATDTTCEYWSCATHGKNYNDEFASKELSSVSATKKMIVVQDTGNTTYGAFIPLDNDGWTGGKYFIFKCKMKVFGDSVPIITGYRAGYWGGIGTFYPGGSDERTNQVAKDGTVTKWVNYDPATCTYTAALYMWRADPKSYNQFKYYNSTNGAHTAIMLGNFVPTSGQNPGVTANCYTTGFAFTDPEIYEATDAAAGTYTGSNLCTPVTDKTVDFSTSYKYSACTQLNGAGEWTDRASNTVMNAPIKTWSKYINTSRVSLSDIPAGYFNGTATPKMLKMAGYTGSSVTAGFNTEIFVDSNTTYQFDMDCRAFGGYSPRLIIYDATSGGYSEVADLTSTFNGYHYTAQFTTRSGLRTTGDGNLRFQLGLHYNSKGTTSAYVSNIQLRKVTGGVATGPNHYMNGDFTFGTVGNVGSDYATQLPHFGSVSNVSTYSDSKLMLIPDDFFNSSDTAISGDTTIALKVQGQDYIEPQFKVRLKAGTYYRFSYDYRNIEDAPEFFVRDDDVTVTKISSTSGGKYRMTYEVYNGGAEDYDRFCFSFGAKSDSKTLYIGNLQLYELTGSGGSTVGANIIGNMNAILDSSVYSGITSSGTNLTLTQDDAENITRDLANGWFVAIPSNVYTNDAQLVKVPVDFFNYLTPAQRLVNLRKVILGFIAPDSINPDYDPNNDTTRSDVKDIVHTKLAALYNAKAITNATDSAKAALLDTVIMVDDDSSGQGTGKKIYVSNSGSDSNNGTSESTPVASISTANNKASAGDTILLKRGDTWRTTTSADPAFTLKAGVHYTAYGTGAKPELLGSAKNYGGSSNSSGWKETSSGSHIWYYDYGSSSTSSAGMIYFIDADGTVHPGKSIGSPDTSKNIYTYSAADLDSDLEYFAPYKANILNGDSGGNITAGSYSSLGRMYVYSTSNPATRFPRIEIALGHVLVEGKNGTSAAESGVTSLSNIAIKFGGHHGIKGVSGGSNFWINKCEIAYIGGAHQYTSSGGGYNRLGNGVEFGNGYSNGRVYDCYVHDCFDAGVTFQSYGSGSAITFSNIYFCRNVIENCAYNVEFFMNRNANDSMNNIYIEDNILRDAGYGWGCYDRADGGYRIANIAASKNTYINNVSNTYIRNNIFDCTRMAHVMWSWSTDGVARHAGLTATGNTYIQRKGAADWAVMAYGPIAGGYKYASDKASLAAAVATFDTAPNAVIWLGDLG